MSANRWRVRKVRGVWMVHELVPGWGWRSRWRSTHNGHAAAIQYADRCARGHQTDFGLAR